MVFNLVEKYGLVPQALYPDSWNAMNSRSLNHIVVAKLREYALTLRKLIGSSTATAATLSGTKQKMMREIHLILTLTLGPPPSSTDDFEWTYLDKNSRAHTVSMTPLEFAKDISSPEFRITSSAVAAMVSLVHDPRHEPLSLMTVDRLGNIVGGRGITYINVPMATLKRACVATLKSGVPIFFGCDVGQFSDRFSGISKWFSLVCVYSLLASFVLCADICLMGTKGISDGFQYFPNTPTKHPPQGLATNLECCSGPRAH